MYEVQQSITRVDKGQLTRTNLKWTRPTKLDPELAWQHWHSDFAANVQLKARLLTKGKLRPHDMVRNKLPDGAGLLEELPRRARSGADEGDEAADAAYCAAIDKVSRVFGR